MSVKFWGGLGILLTAVMACEGHGIAARPVEDGIGIQAVYDDGYPVAFGDVKVFAPDRADKPALEGLTDRNGCFMFRPDTNGTWRVTVDDGMGHAVSHELYFDGGKSAAMQSKEPVSKRHGVMTGLSLIFGLFGWIAYLRGQRAERRRE